VRNSFVNIASRHSTTTLDSADNNRSSFRFPGDKPTYCQGRRQTSRLSLVAVATTILLKFTGRTGSVTPVAVKQTDRHRHGRRRCEIHHHRRFRPLLRHWYMRCSLLGTPLFPLTFRCGQPVSYSLRLSRPLSYCIICIQLYLSLLDALICIIIHLVLQLAISSHRTITIYSILVQIADLCWASNTI